MLAVMAPMLSFLFEAVLKDAKFHCLDNKGKRIYLPGAYTSFVNWTRVFPSLCHPVSILAGTSGICVRFTSPFSEASKSWNTLEYA